MSKKSINKEFHARAEVMTLQELSKEEIIQDLAQEYYDEKRISREVNKIIPKKFRKAVSMHKKILFVFGIIMFLVAVVSFTFTRYSVDIIDKSEFYVIDIYNAIVALFLCFSILPSKKNKKLQYHINIMMSGYLIYESIKLVISSNELYLPEIWFTKLGVWITVFLLNLYWVGSDSE